MNIKVNEQKHLFIFSIGTGLTCLGFDRCHQLSKKMADEMGIDWDPNHYGEVKDAEQYLDLVREAEKRHLMYGFRSMSQMTPELIGFEGKRVQVEDTHGAVRRFIVGLSSGFIPVHIELKTRRSTSGPGVTGAPFKSVRVLPG